MEKRERVMAREIKSTESRKEENEEKTEDEFWIEKEEK